MRVLILDDDPNRHDGFKPQFVGCELVHVYSYDEFTMAICMQPRFDLACLDHDLTPEQSCRGYNEPVCGPRNDGTMAARFLVGLPPELRPKRVLVHSWNPEGAERMVAILREAGVDVVRQRYRALGGFAAEVKP